MLEPDLVADPDAPMTRTAHEASRSCVAPLARSTASDAPTPERPTVTPRDPADPLLQAFEASYGALLRYVEQRVGNTADAADIVQETYVRLRAANQDEALGNPQAYVYRVASNLLIDTMRRRAFRGQYVRSGTLPEEVASEEPSLERQLVDSERLALLLKAVNSLPTRCREVFILRKIHHLEFAEIERRLGISRTMVDRHLRKALLRCAQAVGGA